MISVDVDGNALSTAFYNKINSASRHFQLKLTRVDVSPETDLNLTYRKATFHRGSCGGSQFFIGCAYASSITVTALYDSMLLEGARVRASIGLLMDRDNDEYTWVNIGLFTIQKPVKEHDMMTFTAVDDMLLNLDVEYTSTLTYPATISDIITELETNYNLDIVLTAPIGSCTLTTPISVVGVRSVIQVLAALSLGFAYVNCNGQIVIDYYNRSGDIVDVDFNLVKTQPTMDEDATLFDGIQVQAETITSDNSTVSSMFAYPDSATHYASVGCPYMTQDIFDIVKMNFVGFTYNGGSVNFMGNPLIEPGDVLKFKGLEDEEAYNLITDASNNIVTHDSNILSVLDYVTYYMSCMEVQYEFDGGLTTTVTAPGSFETTDATTQPGVLTQLVQLQDITGQTASELISTTRTVANDAKQIADTTNQYFWHVTVDDGSGVGTGAHITEVPQAQFVSDPDNGGGNLLARSNGIALRDGIKEIAQFAPGLIRMFNNQGIPFFDVALDDATQQIMVFELITLSANSTATITLNIPDSASDIVDGQIHLATMVGFGTADLSVGTAQTGVTIASGVTVNYDGHREIVVINTTSNSGAFLAYADAMVATPSFTLGTRQGDSGKYSAVIGQGLTASTDHQTVVGKFNEPDENDDYAFIIGNGSGELQILPSLGYKTSNAFTVDWDGNGTFAGSVIPAGGSNTLLSGSYSQGSSVTFSKNPKLFQIFRFGNSEYAMRGIATWVSSTEIRGFSQWVTSTPNVYLCVFGISNISGTSGTLSLLSVYNKNSNTLVSGAKLTELVGII